MGKPAKSRPEKRAAPATTPELGIVAPSTPAQPQPLGPPPAPNAPQPPGAHGQRQATKDYYADAKDVQIALRRRARRTERTSWLFLFLILLAIIAAGAVTYVLLQKVEEGETAALNKFIGLEKDRLGLQLKDADAQIQKLKPELADQLTGLGVDWQEVLLDGSTNASIQGAIESGNRVILVRNSTGGPGGAAFLSSDVGQSWHHVLDMPGGSFGSRIEEREGGFLFISALGVNKNYYSTTHGAIWHEIPSAPRSYSREACESITTRVAFSDRQFIHATVCKSIGNRLAIQSFDFATRSWSLIANPVDPAIGLLELHVDSNGNIIIWVETENAKAIGWTRKTLSGWERLPGLPAADFYAFDASEVLLLTRETSKTQIKLIEIDAITGVTNYTASITAERVGRKDFSSFWTDNFKESSLFWSRRKLIGGGTKHVLRGRRVTNEESLLFITIKHADSQFEFVPIIDHRDAIEDGYTSLRD